MRRCRTLLLALPIVACAAWTPLRAQFRRDTPHPPQYWLLGGVGGGTAGVAAGAEASFAVGHSAFSARAITQFPMSWNLKDRDPEGSIVDLGLLYGYFDRIALGYTLFSGGVGMVSFNEEVSDSSGVRRIEHRSVPGIPLSAQLFFAGITGDGFSGGLGGYLYANINPRRPYIGALFCLQVGYY